MTRDKVYTEPRKNNHPKSKYYYFELLLILKMGIFGFFGIMIVFKFLTTHQIHILPIISFVCVITDFFIDIWYSLLKIKKYNFSNQKIIFHHFGILLYPLRISAAFFWATNVYLLAEGSAFKFFLTAIILYALPLGVGQKLSR